MTKNLGGLERGIRALIGVAGIGAYFMGALEGNLALGALIVGAIMLGTSAIGWCPPYAIFGINTCSSDK